MKRLKVDLVDEHYYRPPQWFLDNATRYDNYDRKGPKVLLVNMQVTTKIGRTTSSRPLPRPHS